MKDEAQKPPKVRHGISNLILANTEKKVAALVYYSFQGEDEGGTLEAIFTDYLDRKIKGD